MEKPWIDVAIAIIFHEERYLITRRKKGAHLAELWEFPGGKRHPSETLEQCLHREVNEELGVTIQVQRTLGRIEHDYSDRKVALHSYLCALTSGTPRALASEELKWVLPQTLLSYPFPEANLPLLKRLSEGADFT